MNPKLLFVQDFVRLKCSDENGSVFKPLNHHLNLYIDFATFYITLYRNHVPSRAVAAFSQTPCILCKLYLLRWKYISVWRDKNNFLLMSQRFMLLQT